MAAALLAQTLLPWLTHTSVTSFIIWLRFSCRTMAPKGSAVPAGTSAQGRASTRHTCAAALLCRRGQFMQVLTQCVRLRTAPSSCVLPCKAFATPLT